MEIITGSTLSYPFFIFLPRQEGNTQEQAIKFDSIELREAFLHRDSSISSIFAQLFAMFQDSQLLYFF
jgi:hypothetical protein